MASFAGLLSHPVSVSSLLNAVSTLTDELAAVVTPAGGGAAARRTRPSRGASALIRDQMSRGSRD